MHAELSNTNSGTSEKAKFLPVFVNVKYLKIYTHTRLPGSP